MGDPNSHRAWSGPQEGHQKVYPKNRRTPSIHHCGQRGPKCALCPFWVGMGGWLDMGEKHPRAQAKFLFRAPPASS